jgi:hypothetical protein
VRSRVAPKFERQLSINLVLNGEATRRGNLGWHPRRILAGDRQHPKTSGESCKYVLDQKPRLSASLL